MSHEVSGRQNHASKYRCFCTWGAKELQILWYLRRGTKIDLAWGYFFGSQHDVASTWCFGFWRADYSDFLKAQRPIQFHGWFCTDFCARYPVNCRGFAVSDALCLRFGHAQIHANTNSLAHDVQKASQRFSGAKALKIMSCFELMVVENHWYLLFFECFVVWKAQCFWASDGWKTYFFLRLWNEQSNPRHTGDYT